MEIPRTLLQNLIFLFLVSFSLGQYHGSNLKTENIQDILDECNVDTDCPVSNGYQKICSRYPPFYIGLCSCPFESESENKVCYPRPSKIGETCRYITSCIDIQGAAHCPESTKQCECLPGLYPSEDLTSCIPQPQILDDACSSFASCDAILGAICLETQTNAFQCKCGERYFPNFDWTACYQPPMFVGDYCSLLNPCTDIQNAVCLQRWEFAEPTCSCPFGYSPNLDGRSCVVPV